MKKGIAEKLIKKPLYFAGCILATGQADAMVLVLQIQQKEL